MSTERNVAGHYGRPGLENLVLSALAKQGKDLKELSYADLAPLDEFHVGGLDSTQELARQMELRRGLRLLDVGSGVGGPARYVAAEYGCNVTGIDLTEEFVQVAASLTRLLKLEHLAEFQQASAVGLPFKPNTFDRAWMIHVGMNIADKGSVYREVRRVLKPDGLFVIFDFMRTGEGALHYPVPWAVTEDTSFVVDIESYRQALAGAGFRVERERGRRAFAVDFMQQVIARMAESGPPAVGLHLLLGEKAPVMARNVLSMMKDGLLEPVEMFARPA